MLTLVAVNFLLLLKQVPHFQTSLPVHAQAPWLGMLFSLTPRRFSFIVYNLFFLSHCLYQAFLGFPLGELQTHLILLSFALLCFTDVNVFYKLKSRPSISKKIVTFYTVEQPTLEHSLSSFVWNQTHNVPEVCL